MPHHAPRSARWRFLCAATLLTLGACAGPTLEEPVKTTHPIVIAHRGASGSRPEHTLEGYLLAIEQGADFIEPDLVPTRDGVLIARHENLLAEVELSVDGDVFRDEAGELLVLSATTDVADREEFSDRLAVKRLDGRWVGGWFSEDFSLAEVRSLYARERIPEVRPRSAAYDDRYRVPTFDEVLCLVQAVEEVTGRRIGIYPETKHPTYFAREGEHLDGTPIELSLGELLIEALLARDFTDPDRVFIQSFELENLLELKHELLPPVGLRLPLIQLLGDVDDQERPPRSGFGAPYDVTFHTTRGVDLHTVYGALADQLPLGPQFRYADLATPNGLERLAASHAAGIGPWKNNLLDPALDGAALVRDARSAGLEVHPYTLRAEPTFRSPGHETLASEAARLLDLGVTGYFADHPAEGVAARDAWLDRAPRPAVPLPHKALLARVRERVETHRE
ncbi:MAG: glycerophosphodiester phosphodiesterase family protein [Planctomycetota bacterium]